MNRWLLLLLYLTLAALSVALLTSLTCGGIRMKYLCAVFSVRTMFAVTAQFPSEQCFNGTIGIFNFVTHQRDAAHTTVESTARSMYRHD